MANDEEYGAPGWDAIDAACRAIYGSQEPRHVGYPPGVRLGSGLQGCSAFDARDHWHYVTYGLTELWDKEEDSDPDVSGWGYELTFRLTNAGEDQAPGWPFGVLETIARYTRTNAWAHDVGDRIDLSGLTSADGPQVMAVAVTLDAELGPVDSDNGSFEFRQLVGITAEELAEMRATSTEEVLERLRAGNPLLVTDPSRFG